MPVELLPLCMPWRTSANIQMPRPQKDSMQQPRGTHRLYRTVALLRIAEHSRPRKSKFNSCLAPFQASSSTDAAEGSWLERFLVNYKVRLPSVQRWNSLTRACAEEGMTSEDLGTMLEEDVAIEAAHTEAERESDLSAPGLLKLSRFEGIQDLASVSKVRRPAGMCPGSMGRSDLAQARAHHTA